MSTGGNSVTPIPGGGGGGINPGGGSGVPPGPGGTLASSSSSSGSFGGGDFVMGIRGGNLPNGSSGGIGKVFTPTKTTSLGS